MGRILSISIQIKLFLLFKHCLNVMVEKNAYLNGKNNINKKERQEQESNKRIILVFDVLSRDFIAHKFLGVEKGVNRVTR